LWFIIGVVYLAAISLADFAMFNYLGFNPRVSDVEFSVISGLWSVVFILSNELLGRLADHGDHRGLAMISAISISVALLLFGLSHGSVLIIGLAYLVHAVSSASANLAFSTSIVELTPGHSWSLRSTEQRVGLQLIRGLSLLVIAILTPLIGEYGPIIAALAAATALGLAFVSSLPPSVTLLERRLQRVFTGLSGLGLYNASVAALIGGRYGIIYEASSATRKARASPVTIAASAALAAFVGDYYLTALPLYLRSESVTFSQYAMAFGVAGLAAAALMVLAEAYSASAAIVATLIVTRGLWMAFALYLVKGLADLALYIVVSLVLFASIELTLYKLFLSYGLGYNVHTYAVLKELGSMMGSFLGGPALLAGPYAFWGLPLAATAAAAGLLMTATR